MFVRRWLFAVIAAVVSSAAAQAEPFQLCIHSLTDIPAPASAAFRAELRLLFPKLNIVAKTNPCPAVAEGQVLILVRDTDPSAPEGALGRASVANGRILPSLEVFLDPVAALAGTQDLETLGQALGRVAGHELLHYLLQETGHREEGLLCAGLGASELRSDDRRNYVSLVAR